MRAAILFSLVYPIVGVLFALPANSATSHDVRFAWRLAAWLVSAATFAAHIAYEHVRKRAPLRAASHVGGAVAFGAFLLAVWINMHQSAIPALSVFPAVTGIPAFAVAFVIAAILARVTGARLPD